MSWEGGQVSVAELEAVVASIGSGKLRLSGISEKRVTDILEQHAFTTAAVRQGRSLGLHTPAVMREVAMRRDQVIASAQLAGIVATRFSEPSDDEVKEFFDGHSGKFQALPSYEISIIFIGKGDPRIQAARADEVRGRIESGQASFSQEAERVSEHPSAKDGGYLGWVVRRAAATIGPNFLREINELQPGVLSRWVRQDDALWLIYLHDSRPARSLGYDEAKGEARRHLIRQRLAEVEAAVTADLQEGLDLHIVGDLTDPGVVRE